MDLSKNKIIAWLKQERHFGNTPIARALSFFAILSAVIIVASHIRGGDGIESLSRAYHYYFESLPIVNEVVNKRQDIQKKGIKALQYSNEIRLNHKQKPAATIRIALHPLNTAQYRQTHSDAEQTAEWVSSLLTIELGKATQFELVDRTHLSDLFAEKSRLLVNNQSGIDSTMFDKLPPSDYSLLGTLSSKDDSKTFSLKLIKNSTGQVFGAGRFNFTLDNIEQAIKESSALVKLWLAEVNESTHLRQDNLTGRVAIGHFIEIAGKDSDISQGWDISEQLIESLVKDKNRIVLLRTQMFPLLFEEYLHKLQYTDQYQVSQRPVSNILIHGKYRRNLSDSTYPLSIYLYVDQIKYGRELILLKAHNWEHANKLIYDAIKERLPNVDNKVTVENIASSKQLFLDALSVRGLESNQKVLQGKRAPSDYTIKSFVSARKPENIDAARQLIEQSLQLNPNNQYAKLVQALFLEQNDEIGKSSQMLKEILRFMEPDSASFVFSLLEERRRAIQSNLSAKIFAEIAGANRSEKVFQVLIDQHYLKNSFAKVTFNGEQKYEDVFNQTHTLQLNGFDSDLSFLLFEKLRSIAYQPETQVEYFKPSNFHSRDVNNKRTWPQRAYSSKHNAEAVIHHELARTVSGIHMMSGTYTHLPAIEFYPEINLESAERRLSNLEFAVDSFSSSIYLDDTYLQAAVFLGYTFCQERLDRCAAGKMVHSWIVDNNKGANIDGGGGIYFNVTKDDEEKDRLIFLAADAVDRVQDANLSEMFQNILRSKKYFINKQKAQLTPLLTKSGKKADGADITAVVLGYGKLIETYCRNLENSPRSLREIDKYQGPMESLGKLASRNEQAKLMRKNILKNIEMNFPTTYPHLLINTKPVAPFIVNEQDDMVRKVAMGEIVPRKISVFMKSALMLFESRVTANKIDVATQYIKYFEKYYGISDKTAMDFSYFYHRVGDLDFSNKLLQKFGKKSFNVSKFTLEKVNGDYEHNGFDDKGRLTFINVNKPKISFVYQASIVRYGLGEPIKWRLHSGGRSHSGNSNQNPNMFGFGNGSKYFGIQRWADADMAITTAITPEISQAEKIAHKNTEVEEINGGIKSFPKDSTEHLFMADYTFTNMQQIAFKGFPYKSTVGPLQDEYFHSYFSQTRTVNVVKELLFEKGYLTVAGIPTFSSQGELYQQIKDDFPSYSHSERRAIRDALVKAKNVTHAGSVDIYQRQGNTWKFESSLLPQDAMNNRYFGIASAIYGDKALVCDAKNGMYSFSKNDGQWVQQERIAVSCYNVAMNNEWAIIEGNKKLFVFKMIEGLWHKTQTIVANNYLLNEDKGHNYESFGNALLILGNTLFVGNPYGGGARTGEVYQFTLSEQKWRQSGLLLPNNNHSKFGAFISVSDELLIIGDPSAGTGSDPTWPTGSVSIYKKQGIKWQLIDALAPKKAPKRTGFGSRVLAKPNQQGKLLIKSNAEVYRYDVIL